MSLTTLPTPSIFLLVIARSRLYQVQFTSSLEANNFKMLSSVLFTMMVHPGDKGHYQLFYNLRVLMYACYSIDHKPLGYRLACQFPNLNCNNVDTLDIHECSSLNPLVLVTTRRSLSFLTAYHKFITRIWIEARYVFFYNCNSFMGNIYAFSCKMFNRASRFIWIKWP